MWLGSAGSTAMFGSLFGVIPSQSRRTFADGSPEARHSSFEGVFESWTLAWSPRPPRTSVVAASGRNFEPFGAFIGFGVACTAWLNASTRVVEAMSTTRVLFTSPPPGLQQHEPPSYTVPPPTRNGRASGERPTNEPEPVSDGPTS